jgi:transposase
MIGASSAASCTCCDCPSGEGPYTTVYNRFNRWSRQGLWLEIFETLTRQSPIHGLAMIDSTHIKVHRSAGGAKRGAIYGRSASRAVAKTSLESTMR